jgi:hypothetical protein
VRYRYTRAAAASAALTAAPVFPRNALPQARTRPALLVAAGEQEDIRPFFA